MTNVYFDLEPFELDFASNDPVLSRTADPVDSKSQYNQITKEVHDDEDEWIEQMCSQDANQFLSSIHKKGNITRSPFGSQEIFKIDEGRDDCGNQACKIQPARAKNTIDKSNDQRDTYYNENNGGHDITNRKNEKMNAKVDAILNHSSSPIQKSSHYMSSFESIESRTPAPKNKFQDGSTESSGSHPPLEKCKFSSSSEMSWSSVSFPYTKEQQKIKRKGQLSHQLDDSVSSTKLILEDLIDLQTKMDKSVIGKESTKAPEQRLCELLWDRQWNRARHRLQIHPEEARQKIKLHYVSIEDEDLQKNETSSDTRSALPLHLTCAVRPLPPTAFLQDLINAYPEACHQFEEYSGMLPIHMAANLRPFEPLGLSKEGEKQISEELPTRTIFMDKGGIVEENIQAEANAESINHESVINLLLMSNPESITAKETINGMSPLHIAASTTRAENGIVSPVASHVLNILMVTSPFDAVNCWKDNNGMTPYDWAWRNVDYFCPHCGMETAKTCIDETTNCKCPQSLSVSEMCLHPFLRKDIRAHLVDSAKPSIRLEATADDVVTPIPTQKSKFEASLSSARKQRALPDNNGSRVAQDEGTISPLELNNIRDYANPKMAFRKMTSNTDALRTTKNATLHLKVCLSELVHPSNHGRKRRGLGFSRNAVPNPFFEVFAAHRRGMSKSYYKSYPLRETTEGTWEDAFLDLGLTHKQLQNGTNGAGYIEVGIRVMHCPRNGSKIKLIGSCQLSLETLQKEQEERLRLQNEVTSLKSMVGDTHASLPEPEKHPVLKGFEVTGKLQVVSLAIE